MSSSTVSSLLRRWISRWLDHRGLGNIADSVDRKAAEVGNVDALHDMARRAIARNEWDRAIELLGHAMTIAPSDPTLLCSIGAAYRNKGEFEASREAYEHALRLNGSYAEVLSNLGEWCIAKGQPEEALIWLDRALSIAPGSFEVRVNKTAALFELSRYEQALSLAEQLATDEPSRAEAYLNLGNVLVHTGKTKRGIKQYQKALELQPNYAEAHFNLSSLLGSKEDQAQAIGYLERRLVERGDSVQNLGMLAAAHQAAGNLEKAELLCRRILDRQPNNTTALITLGSCLSNGGDSAAAMTLYRKVIEVDSTQAAMGSNLLFESNNLDGLGRQKIFEFHREWASRFEAPLLEHSDFSMRDRDPGRKLRIGYVSGDFVRHPVGFLLRDILRHHNAEQFSVHCFSMAIRPETVLPELRDAADTWEDIFFLSDEEVVDLIRKSEIDILIDLSGHTAFHRLMVFAKRPAPVQVEWIGYFHSTGMTSMDYFITDPYTSPPDSGQMFSETPLYLPHTRFCYGPPEYACEVVPPPYIRNSFVTFGSFNRLPKITDDVVAAWSRILLGVPRSRMVIKSGALSECIVCDRLLARFTAHGIEADRLDLRKGSLHSHMLAEYGDIDIALDTFPFNGGMTTLEAMWMGVPVITRAGNSVVSRQTVSALSSLALADELAFDDVDSYVDGAIRLANDRQRLDELRKQLRPSMERSPLRNSRQFTQDLEELLRQMWAAWCKGEKLPSALNQFKEGAPF